MTDLKLTREEIRKAFDDAEPDFEGAPMIWDGAEAIALAAQKGLVEKLNEPCTEHYSMGKDDDHAMQPLRRNCPECWQALCAELEVK